MNNKERQQNWSNYWKNNSLDSCSQGVQSKDSDIEQFWYDCAGNLSSDYEVLDLCTGRGDVIKKLINSQIKLGKDVSSYTGVDLSKIDRALAEKRFQKLKANVDFVYDTSIDEMPFEAERFDVITSQFGLEYNLNKKSLAEVFRVLKKNGTAKFVIHHDASIMVGVAKEERGHTLYLLNNTNILQLVEKLIPVFAKLRNPANVKKLKQDKVAVALRNQFNTESNSVLTKIEESNTSDILQEALKLSEIVFRMAKEQGALKAKEKLKKYISELKQSKLRMDELIEAALSKEDINQLQGTVNQFGRSVDSVRELKSNDHKVAWGLVIS